MNGIIGVEWKRRKYIGVSVATRDGRGWARKVFGGPQEDFHKHIMDAKVYIIQQGLMGMSSSSVDDFTCDNDGWAWCENGVVGSYVVPEKWNKDKWHEFQKQSKDNPDKRSPMWILNGGNVAVIQEKAPTKKALGKWNVLHADADEVVVIREAEVAAVLDKAEKAKVEKRMRW